MKKIISFKEVLLIGVTGVKNIMPNYWKIYQS